MMKYRVIDMRQMSVIFGFLKYPPFSTIEEAVLGLAKPLPKLPQQANEIFVTAAPYLSAFAGVMSAISAIYGLLAQEAVFFSDYRSVASTVIVAVQSIVSAVFLLSAFVFLYKKELLGWRLLFWTANISIAGMILSLDVFGAIFMAALAWYVLTQIRNEYSE